MRHESYAYPVVSLERLNSLVMTLYAGTDVEDMWRSVIIEKYENAKSEDELRMILRQACDLAFIIMNTKADQAKELVNKILNMTRKKPMFYINEEGLVKESSYLIDVLTRFVNPNAMDIITNMTTLKDVIVRTKAMILSIKGTSLYQGLVEQTGIDENVVEQPCKAKYYRECLDEKKQQLLTALQFIRMNLNIPR